MQGPLCHPGTLCLQPSAPSARQELGAGCGMEPAWCWGERTILHVQALLQNHRGWWGWGGTPGGDLDRTLPHQGSVEPLAQPQVLAIAGDPMEVPPQLLGAIFFCVWSPVSPVSSGWAQGNTWRWGKRSQSWTSVQRIREQPAGEAPRQLQAARCRRAQRGANLGNSGKRGKCRNFTAESG